MVSRQSILFALAVGVALFAAASFSSRAVNLKSMSWILDPQHASSKWTGMERKSPNLLATGSAKSHIKTVQTNPQSLQEKTERGPLQIQTDPRILQEKPEGSPLQVVPHDFEPEPVAVTSQPIKPKKGKKSVGMLDPGSDDLPSPSPLHKLHKYRHSPKKRGNALDLTFHSVYAKPTITHTPNDFKEDKNQHHDSTSPQISKVSDDDGSREVTMKGVALKGVGETNLVTEAQARVDINNNHTEETDAGVGKAETGILTSLVNKETLHTKGLSKEDLSDEEVQGWQHSFDALDPDENGHITASSYIKWHGGSFVQSLQEEIAKDVNQFADHGVLNLKAFARMKKHEELHQKEFAKSMFDSLDKDNDGSIHVDDLIKWTIDDADQHSFKLEEQLRDKFRARYKTFAGPDDKITFDAFTKIGLANAVLGVKTIPRQ